MFSNRTRHLDLNNEGHLRWHEANTTHTENEELKPTDTYNNNEWPYHVPFAHSNVSTPPCLSGDNLVQPTDELLHSELICLQVNDFIRKEFISVTDAEEFYKKYSCVMGFSIRKDRYFGDVMSFDSMYQTYAYNRSMVIFVGVNHYTKTTILGFGLLVDKTVDTYSWILQTFLEAMHGKCLISVVIDGDKAMSKAIRLVMPFTVRRLCCWHLEQNVHTNVCDTGFTQAFTHCMLAYMTEAKFETQWLNDIKRFGL
ncbi:hypothetical protein Ddye_005292 [Dipteronia dyeriana]|uniref:MULE transposase domain-containing protein n=1 Tax=Dipteronia dyeriana TaxID=168575 RepID=A0AAD9XG03_9ROSI|nr:hypothetical protein Ddye_005292 [Dipteronia dyeriana]